MDTTPPICGKGPLFWKGRRITREERRTIEEAWIDGALLQSCALNNQAIIVDSCKLERASRLIFEGVSRVPDDSIVWTIAIGSTSYKSLRRNAESVPSGVLPRRSHQVFDIHPLYGKPLEWREAGIKMLLTDVYSLRDKGIRNPRRRADILSIKVNHISIVDPEFSICNGYRYIDYSWRIRDLLATLASVQAAVPVIVWTERPLISLNTAFVRKSLGVDGLIYFELE